MYKALLVVYKFTFSWVLVFLTGSGCRFNPTCSVYAAQALTKYGIVKGTVLSLKRVSKCNPWGASGDDPLK